MRSVLFFACALAVSLLSCQDPDASEGQSPGSGENPAEGAAPEASSSEDLCFASVSDTPDGAPQGKNYHFVRFFPANGDQVEGVFYHAPFGTDGSKGSLQGTYDRQTGEVSGQATLLAEGDRYGQDRTYKVLDDALDLGYTDPDGDPATLAKVSCATYDDLFKEYQYNLLGMNLNTSDRTRLDKIEAFRERTYAEEDQENFRFMERAVNLDNDWETQEFLVYPMDPIYCGTGGCTLWVVNEKGETLAETSVVKLPIYMEIPTAEESMANKGKWQDLFVWSQGMRRLNAENGTYPDNASVEPQVEETEVTLHPEKYQLLLDYMD